MLNQKSNSILVAIPCLLLGGTEYQTLNLVKALVKNNYKVTILCYFEYNNTMVHYMEEEGAKVILLSANGTRTKGIKNTMTFLYKGFKKVLKEVSPSVVHIQYMAPGSLSVLLFRFLGVKNIIATAHVPGHIYKRKIIPQLLTKYFLKAFICVSKSSEKDFFEKEPKLYRDELYTQGRKHFTIYNCTETNVNIKKQEKDYINIGIVSRLSHEKGIDIAIKTMKYIIKKYPSAKLTIVGDGGKKEELQALTKKLKLSSYISFEGLQPKEKLESYYNSFDFVFVPSRFEGFGLTAIEAMSYGIPVIASSADGLKEVIEDNISGLLVKTSDPKDYANEIMKLLDDTTYKAIISKNAQQRVIDNFSFETFEKQTISLYNNITKGQN